VRKHDAAIPSNGQTVDGLLRSLAMTIG